MENNLQSLDFRESLSLPFLQAPQVTRQAHRHQPNQRVRLFPVEWKFTIIKSKFTIIKSKFTIVKWKFTTIKSKSTIIKSKSIIIKSKFHIVNSKFIIITPENKLWSNIHSDLKLDEAFQTKCFSQTQCLNDWAASTV